MLGVFLLQQLEVVEVAITILTKTGLRAALVVVQKAGEYMGLVALVLQDRYRGERGKSLLWWWRR